MFHLNRLKHISYIESREFSLKAGEYPIPWYRSGFRAYLGPELH